MLIISYIIMGNCPHSTNFMGFREIYENKAILEVENSSLLRCDSVPLHEYFLMFALRLLDTEDVGIMILQNLRNYLSNDRASHSRKVKSSAIQPNLAVL
jgi:hypothetical protein